MHRFVVVLFAAAITLTIGLAAVPVGAVTAEIQCALFNNAATFSPGLPIHGDPTKVTPTVSATATFGGCVGLGITGGTVTYSGAVTSPENCDAVTDLSGVGSSTISWSNGQTSTISNGGEFFAGWAITSGLFAGGSFFFGPGTFYTYNPGACSTSPLVQEFGSGPVSFHLPAPGPVRCTSPHPCNTTRAASATVTAPGLAVTVTGSPKSGTGTIVLNVASGTLPCPKVAPTVAPVADLTDTGFKPTDRLNVTATLPLTSSTSAEQVCFHSTVPFKSQSNPTVAEAGTAFLLNCAQVAYVAPCVLSSQQVGSNVVVKFVVSGGDPTFCIVLATGREAYAQHIGTGTVGTAYTAQFQTKGGKAPFHWSLTGNLPPGCAFDAIGATIRGTPTTKGKYDVVVHATDSEKPKGKAAKLDIRITIT
jgi:hypothetical protein